MNIHDPGDRTNEQYNSTFFFLQVLLQCGLSGTNYGLKSSEMRSNFIHFTPIFLFCVTGIYLNYFATNKYN